VVEGVSERRVDCGQENAGCGRMECVDGLEGLPARSLGGGSGVRDHQSAYLCTAISVTHTSLSGSPMLM
jgi:hypothetical protein